MNLLIPTVFSPADCAAALLFIIVLSITTVPTPVVALKVRARFAAFGVVSAVKLAKPVPAVVTKAPVEAVESYGKLVIIYFLTLEAFNPLMSK